MSRFGEIAPRGSRRDTVPPGPAFREVIPRDPNQSFRWRTHSYPDALARWNHHPEYEIHLIRKGTGRFIIGDVIGPFGPGDLFLVGSDLPHDWISDLAPGEVIVDRDVVLQFDPDWFRRATSVLPELSEIEPMLARAARGIAFHGATATEGARMLEEIGTLGGVEAVAGFVRLLARLVSAPAEDSSVVSSRAVDGVGGADSSDVVAAALDYVFANIDAEPRLSVAAEIAGMSESTFSRYFKAASGMTFSDMVKRLRLTQACRMLEHTDAPIAEIAYAVGYQNLSNFNRRFRDEYDVTPSEFRRGTRRMSASELSR